MSDREDLWHAIKTRERSRTWMRGATLAVGAGALATAGVVAYTLPNPPQHKTASTGVAPGSSPAQPTRGYGDDGGGGDDGSQPAPAPAASASQAPVHSTTGGS